MSDLTEDEKTEIKEAVEFLPSNPIHIHREYVKINSKTILKRSRRVYNKDKDKNINFRVSSKVLQQWKDTAKARGMNLTEWITHVCLQEVEDEKLRASRQGREFSGK